MMHLYNGSFNPNPHQNMPSSFPPTSQPMPPPNFSHANIANFGSSAQPQQPFYGQTVPPQNSGINFNAYPGWTGPSKSQGEWPGQEQPPQKK